MNTLQIQSVLSNDRYAKNVFVGVFPCDLLTFKIQEFPAALVVNTDPSWRKGEHWVCFYLDKNKNIEYFDSYGLPPINNEISAFFRYNGVNQTYNKQPLQGMYSKACGHYCILYLISRSRGHQSKNIISTLKSDKVGINDDLVMQFVSKNFNVTQIGKGKGIVCQCCKSYYECCK